MVVSVALALSNYILQDVKFFLRFTKKQAKRFWAEMVLFATY